MIKNEFGQPFMSVKHFTVYSSQIVIPKYTEVNGERTLTSESYIYKTKRRHARSANKVDVRDNIQNMYTWGVKTSLEHDLYVGKYGAVVGLVDNKYQNLEQLLEENEELKKLFYSGYKFTIGPGFDVNEKTGKVKYRLNNNQPAQYRALYCTNFRKFLAKTKGPEELITIEDAIRDNGGLPPLPEDRRVENFNPYQELDYISEERKRKR